MLRSPEVLAPPEAPAVILIHKLGSVNAKSSQVLLLQSSARQGENMPLMVCHAERQNHLPTLPL